MFSVPSELPGKTGLDPKEPNTTSAAESNPAGSPQSGPGQAPTPAPIQGLRGQLYPCQAGGGAPGEELLFGSHAPPSIPSQEEAPADGCGVAEECGSDCTGSSLPSQLLLRPPQGPVCPKPAVRQR